MTGGSFRGKGASVFPPLIRIDGGRGGGGPPVGYRVDPNTHLNFTDTDVTNGTSYHYKVVAVTPAGNRESAPLPVSQALVARYTFEGNTNDVAGTRHATAMDGMTAPGYAPGFGGGQAISLNGSDQYVQLPAGSGNYPDVTLAAWVYWNGGNAWQRVFDFGSEIEKYMMLTVRDGSGKLNFSITTSRATDGTLSLVGPTMPTATWTHVAVTFNGNTATLCYTVKSSTTEGGPYASVAGGSYPPHSSAADCRPGSRALTSSMPRTLPEPAPTPVKSAPRRSPRRSQTRRSAPPRFRFPVPRPTAATSRWPSPRR